MAIESSSLTEIPAFSVDPEDSPPWRRLESGGDGDRSGAARGAQGRLAAGAGCTKCPQLAATRQTVVFGSGNADADLMFVGEAPGANEDRQGLPFVGQAGRLLDTLLEEIGLTRGDVFVVNTLKCRPPGNRDPLPQEIDACQDYLFRQLELIEPRVVCTLGNFATKLLRGDPTTGITRLHGREEIRRIGPRRVRLYPIYHPAAALYTPKMLEALREDFRAAPRAAGARPARAAGAGAEPSRSCPSRRSSPRSSASPRRLSSGSSEPPARRR